MKVYEYGSEHEKTVAMFQCAAEPGWVFIPSAEALAKNIMCFCLLQTDMTSWARPSFR